MKFTHHHNIILNILLRNNTIDHSINIALFFDCIHLFFFLLLKPTGVPIRYVLNTIEQKGNWADIVTFRLTV